MGTSRSPSSQSTTVGTEQPSLSANAVSLPATRQACMSVLWYAARVPTAAARVPLRKFYRFVREVLSEYSYKLSRRLATYGGAEAPHTLVMRVFLVEDAPLLRERLAALIASVGASMVGQAEGASEAIEGILAASPDAVVLDLHLKEGNGFDVLRAVRKAAPAIAFFILTNYPHDGYKTSAMRLGARGFYDKSSEFDKLRDALAAAAA